LSILDIVACDSSTIICGFLRVAKDIHSFSSEAQFLRIKYCAVLLGRLRVDLKTRLLEVHTSDIDIGKVIKINGISSLGNI